MHIVGKLICSRFVVEPFSVNTLKRRRIFNFMINCMSRIDHLLYSYDNVSITWDFPFCAYFLSAGVMSRVYKLSVVQLDFTSTLRNKHATGKMRWRTANWRTRNARQNRCCTPTNHCVKTACWPAVMANVLSVACSVMATKTVMTAPMKTVAVSDNRCFHFGWWVIGVVGCWMELFSGQTRSIVYLSLIMQNSQKRRETIQRPCIAFFLLLSLSRGFVWWGCCQPFRSYMRKLAWIFASNKKIKYK